MTSDPSRSSSEPDKVPVDGQGPEGLDAATIKPSTANHSLPDLPTIVGKAVPPESSVLLPGNTRFGDYELIREIARGGMGIVYQARQISLNRIVAIKMILAGQLASAEDVRRFYVEAEASAKLDHPGIVPIYEIGETDGTHFFSMGFIDGGSLADVLRQGPVRPKEAVRMMSRLCDAMQYAHDHGVIHRDLKPGNVLLQATHSTNQDSHHGEDKAHSSSKSKGRWKPGSTNGLSGSSAAGETLGQPKITDFGLAKQMYNQSELTTTGQILGTPSYMPPEQAEGSLDRIGPLSDVYSLGAIFYCMLTGRPPFQASSPMETLMQVIQTEPVPPRQLNASTPADLETICLKCLHKDPLRRYGSAQEFGDDLNRWLNNEPILARPVGLREKSVLWVRKHQGLAASLALACAACLLAIGLLFVNWMNRAQQIVALKKERDQTLAQERVAKAEREVALKAREVAQDAETRAVQAKSQVEATNRELETLNAKSARSLYAATISLAYQEWSQNNVTRAENLLDNTEPEYRNWEWDYLKQLCHSEWMTLRGHSGIPTMVQMHRDRQHAVSCGDISDPFVYVWRLSDGVAEAKHAGQGIAISRDGLHFACYDRNSHLQLRETLTGLVVWESATLSNRSLIGQFSMDGTRFASVNADRRLRIVDVKNGRVIREFEIEMLEDSSELVFAKNGEWILVRRSPKELAVYESETGIWLKNLDLFGAADERHQLAISDTQNLIAMASGGDVTFADLDSGAYRGQVTGHVGPVLDMMFADNGIDLITCGADASVRVWDSKSFKQIRQFRGHRIGSIYGVLSCAIAADGSKVLSGGADRTIKIWNLDKPSITEESTAVPIPLSNDEAFYMPANRGLVHQLSVSPDGRWIATAGTEHRRGPPVARDGAAALADNNAIIDHSVRILNLSDRVPEATIPYQQSVGAVCFHPKQSMIAIGLGGLRELAGGEIETIDLSTPPWKNFEKRTTYQGASGPISKLLFSPDGSRLFASVGSQRLAHRGELHVWRTDQPERPQLSITNLKGVRDFDVARDGQLLAVADLDSKIKIFNAETGEVVHNLPASNAALAVAFSPDQKRLLCGDQNWSIRLFDLETKDLLWERSEHSGAVFDVVFSPDGERIATASIDKTIRLWDAKTGDLLLTLTNAWQEQLCLDISPQGDAIFSSGSAPYVTGRVVQRRRHLEDTDVSSEGWVDIFRDDFENTGLSQWTAHNGEWTVVDGAAHGILKPVSSSPLSRFNAATLIPKAWMPSTVSIEFDAWAPQGIMFETKLHDEQAIHGMGALHAGLPTAFNDGRLGSSIFVQASGEFVEVAKSDRAFHFVPNQRFHFQAIRRGDRFEAYIDGRKLLETSVPTNLFLPFGHLQASFAASGTEIFVDNVLIRAPQHLDFEKDAIDLEFKLYRELKLKELVIEAIQQDTTLRPESKQFALRIAGLRLENGAKRQSILFSEVLSGRWSRERFAQAAKMMATAIGTEANAVESLILRAALLYAAEDYATAQTVLDSASTLHRKQTGIDHPVACAVEVLILMAEGNSTPAKLKASRLREWMRSRSWKLTSEMQSLVKLALEKAQLNYGENDIDSLNESLLQFTHDRLHDHLVLRQPRELADSFSVEAQVATGRGDAADAHDVVGPWRSWVDSEIAWLPHHSNPFLSMVRLQASVQNQGDDTSKAESIVLLRDQSMFWKLHVVADLHRQQDKWLVDKMRIGILDYGPLDRLSNSANIDWAERDRQVEVAQDVSLRERFRLESQAWQMRRAAVTAKELTGREEATAADWLGRATTAYALHDSPLFLECITQAVALDPQLEGPEHLRFYATRNRSDMEWMNVGSYMRWRFPKYPSFNVKDVSLPGKTIAAWVPSQGSIAGVFVIENAFPDNESLVAFGTELANVSHEVVRAEIVFQRPIFVEGWEAYEVVMIGPGNGMAMVPQAVRFDTIQRYVLLRDGNAVIGILLSTHRDQFVDRSAELQALIDTIEPIPK